MWARHCEVFLGIWLAISWLIFSYTPNMHSMIYFDWAICSLICIFSLSGYLPRLRYCHLMNFIVGCSLIGIAFTSPDGHLPPYQNYMVIGLLLLMFPIVPTNASQPPVEWIAFIKGKKDR